MRCAVKCTIKDVAKAAGVSPSTVSRALHNNPRISEQARERIRALAKEMGFHPNQMARSLVNRRTRVIGIVFPANLAESLGHPFYPQVLQGLGQTAAERRHYVLLGTGQGGETTPEAIRRAGGQRLCQRTGAAGCRGGDSAPGGRAHGGHRPSLRRGPPLRGFQQSPGRADRRRVSHPPGTPAHCPAGL